MLSPARWLLPPALWLLGEQSAGCSALRTSAPPWLGEPAEREAEPCEDAGIDQRAAEMLVRGKLVWVVGVAPVLRGAWCYRHCSDGLVPSPVRFRITPAL